MLNGLAFVKICNSLDGAMFIIALIHSTHLMIYLSLLLVEEFQLRLYDVNALIKPGLTTAATMQNGIISESIIGLSCCGKSTLDVGVIFRPSIKRLIH